MPRKLWTREELKLTLSLCFQRPSGKLNRSTPQVSELARLIGRSENSAALLEFESQELFEDHFARFKNAKIKLPAAHKPSRDFLAYHRDNVFVGY